MSVVEAVHRDLAALRARSPELADSAMAAAAAALAAEIDDPDNSATSKSMCARALSDIFEQLRSLTPAEEPKEDRLVNLAARREARRARSAAT